MSRKSKKIQTQTQTPPKYEVYNKKHNRIWVKSKHEFNQYLMIDMYGEISIITEYEFDGIGIEQLDTSIWKVRNLSIGL